MATPIYVIGHVNPDTDSIASALAYAWTLRERDGINAIAARSGAINQQTAWVLKYLDLEPPVLLTDASPRFESVTRRLDTTLPDKPLHEAWVIASRTGGIAPVIDLQGKPYGLITGKSLFEFLSRQVGPRTHQKSLSIQDILDYPCMEAADTTIPRFQASHRIRDMISRILREEGDEFWVVDENGLYVGICRQRDLLNPPRLKLILVDHNEPHQSVASLDEAELLEIIDHHRLGNPSTHTPIKFTVDVVGSTSTLISELIVEAGLSAPPQLAGIMLAGLLSDTLLLSSPTTTQRDKDAANRLARWAFTVGNKFGSETITSFGEKILAAGAGLAARTATDVVNGDLKVYSAGEFQFGIAQAEVSDLYELAEYQQKLSSALSEIREKNGWDFAILMITDVVRSSSRLLLDNPPPLLEDLPFPPMPDGSLYAEGVVSRKKQLLPSVLGLLEK